VQKLSFLGCVLILVLVLAASCSPSTATTTPSPTSKTPLPTSTATRTAPATTGPATGSPASDVPKYGGTLVKGYTTDVVGFDEVIGFHANPTVPMHLTNEELWGGDWAKGPAGTGQAEYDIGGADRWDLKAGVIAESWEFPQPGTSVWHIRHGIHWWLNQNSEASRLVSGRELTADDVVATLNMYIKTPRAYLASQPGLKDAVITSPEPWTVKITIDPLYAANAIMRFGDFASIVPPEVVKKYGDMSDWRTAEGTGPYMLTDYVSGSSVTLKRNPTYWDKDPVGPGKGNQLPYLDEVRFLIIPDASSMEAAFRTAKIDQTGADWETGPRLLKENSKLLSGKNTFDGGFNTHFNVEGNPLFKDIRVRRAMMMAVNWQSLVKDLFGGDAQINVWPVTYNKQYASLYLSLDDPDCPASVKELYKFDLEKAKSLMKEAGYPNGFKTTVICSNGTTVVDYYSVIKGMWSKLGIDLTIDARESAVHTSVWRGQQWTDLCYSSMGGLGTAFTGGNIYGDQSSNGSRVHDKVVESAVKQMITAVSTQGQGAADKIHRELMKYVLDQAWAVPYPKAPGYRLWWPWVKNYHNEFSIGYWNEGNWTKWTWIDQDIKAKMLSR
jgi:peptide/nickel transport system substrate-binding protein